MTVCLLSAMADQSRQSRQTAQTSKMVNFYGNKTICGLGHLKSPTLANHYSFKAGLGLLHGCLYSQPCVPPVLNPNPMILLW